MPVIMGEYAVMDRDISSTGCQDTFEESHAYYYEYLNRETKNHGIVPFLWETPGNIFNRFNKPEEDSNDASVSNQTTLGGILKGAAEGKYPF